MNLIVICLDSFRQDHVGVYHGGKPVFPEVPPCQTPNIDAFARECVIFDNMTPCGLPTIPIRMETMTGHFSLPYRGWQAMEGWEITLAEVLRREGYRSALISDTYHYRAPGMNYHRSFDAYHWVRGQEYDAYNSAPTRRSIDDYVNQNYPDHWRARIGQYLANTDDFTDESHWFPARVVDQACDWLAKNRSADRLFCWIESFDPHEPWDPPQAFDQYGDSSYHGPRLVLPMGGRAEEWATPEQIRQIRGLYAGEASFVDSRLGPLFACLRDYGYLADSLVVLFADHGHPLADHGKFLKGADRLYSELLKVPFLVRLPDAWKEPRAEPGRRTPALAQFPDVMPTVLDLLGLASSGGSLHGRSFRRAVTGESDIHRESTISGYFGGRQYCIRDGQWSFIDRPEGEPDELYRIDEDPQERENLVDRHPDEARRLAGQYGSYWRQSPARFVKGIQERYEMASGAVE